MVAGSTVSLAVSTGGLGAFIAGGLSGGVGNGSEGGGGGVVPFLGGAEGRRRGGVGWMVGGVVLWVLWVS